MNSQKFGMTLGSFFLVCSSVAHAYGSAVDLKSAPVQETPKQAANGSNDCRTRFTNIISGRIMADLPVGRWSNRITNGLKAEDRYMRACLNSVSLWKGDKLNVEEGNILRNTLIDALNGASDSDKTKIRSALAVINSQVAPETVRTADRGTFSAH